MSPSKNLANNEKGLYEMNAKKPEEERAARLGQQAAAKNQSQDRPYPKGDSLSRRKTLIGELLLFGNKQRKEFWWLFDSKVRQFYDLKLPGGMP